MSVCWCRRAGIRACVVYECVCVAGEGVRVHTCDVRACVYACVCIYVCSYICLFFLYVV